MSDKTLANKINKVCLQLFEALPKTGKPTIGEHWTVLACIVLDDNRSNQLEVISLGTGTKCLGADQMSPKGDVVNDCHAEVLARRGFIRYLYDQLLNCHNHIASIFYFDETTRKFCLKTGLRFHFYTTHSPCGDASIFETTTIDEPNRKKIKLDEEFTSHEYGNILKGFTGARLFVDALKGETSDLMAQDVGQIRTKPGRGIRTLSVSCSDKFAKWNVLGIQGALLMVFLEYPIYISSLTYASNAICDIEASRRALWERFDDPNLSGPFEIHRPEILQSDDELNRFRFSKPHITTERESRPCPTSIAWCKVKETKSILEIATPSGKKLGVTKKNLNTPATRLKISKKELFRQFIAIRKLYPVLESESPRSDNNDRDNFDNLCYADAKKLAVDYQLCWRMLKDNNSYFKVWTRKSNDLLKFTVDEI